ncbi:MAG TPA: cupin domain-containing protein [Pseudomonadales bacterium]|nr:cupin domain-containing protein [Pseudomonadales bacterium]
MTHSANKPASPAVLAHDVPPSKVQSILPEPLASRFKGRERRRLGEHFGLLNFGVNLTRLAPGGISAFRHAHKTQDEFIYVLEGRPTLNTETGPVPLSPGMCAGFRAGTGEAHNLTNNSDKDVLYLEVGDRSAGDEATYPDEDLKGVLRDGAWVFTRKDGSPIRD